MRPDKSQSSLISGVENEEASPRSLQNSSEHSGSPRRSKKGMGKKRSQNSQGQRGQASTPSLEEILISRQIYEETMQGIFPDFPTTDMREIKDYQDFALQVHE